MLSMVFLDSQQLRYGSNDNSRNLNLDSYLSFKFVKVWNIMW